METHWFVSIKWCSSLLHWERQYNQGEQKQRYFYACKFARSYDVYIEVSISGCFQEKISANTRKAFNIYNKAIALNQQNKLINDEGTFPSGKTPKDEKVPQLFVLYIICSFADISSGASLICSDELFPTFHLELL